MGDIPPPRNPPPVHTFPPTPSPLGEPVQQRIPPRSLSWPVCPGDSELQYAPRACTPLGVPANRMIPPRAIRLAGTPSLGKPPRGLSPKFLGGHTPLPPNADFAYACPDPSPRKTNLLFLSSRGLLHLRNDPLPNLEPFAHHTLPKPHRGVQPYMRPSSDDLASGRDSKKESQPPLRHMVPRGRCAPTPTMMTSPETQTRTWGAPRGELRLAATSRRHCITHP